MNVLSIRILKHKLAFYAKFMVDNPFGFDFYVRSGVKLTIQMILPAFL